MKLIDYLENKKFENEFVTLSEGILNFPTKSIFQTFNTLSRDEKTKILNILNKELNKALSSEEKRKLLDKVMEILVKKNPLLVKEFAEA